MVQNVLLPPPDPPPLPPVSHLLSSSFRPPLPRQSLCTISSINHYLQHPGHREARRSPPAPHLSSHTSFPLGFTLSLTPPSSISVTILFPFPSLPLPRVWPVSVYLRDASGVLSFKVDLSLKNPTALSK